MSGPEQDAAPESFADVRKTGNRTARIVPWLVTVGAFAFIFATTDFEGMRESAAGANWLLFWGVMFVLYSILFLVDSATVWWVYRRFHVPHIRYSDVLPARGASYLLGILNYAAGAAAMAFYFKKRFNVGVIEGGASLLLLMLVDLGLVASAALIGGSMLPAEWRPFIVIVAAAFACGAIGHLVFWRARWSWGPLERIRNIESLRGFRDAKVIDYCKIAAIRAPVTVLYIVAHGLTLLSFHIYIPLNSLLVYVPIQMLIAVLPISPSGLGTVNVAQRYLYGPFMVADGSALTMEAAHAAIDAYGLALSVGFNLPRAIIGVLMLRAAARALATVRNNHEETP